MPAQVSSVGQIELDFDQLITDGKSPGQSTFNIAVDGPGYAQSNGTGVFGTTQNLTVSRRGISELMGGTLIKNAVGDSQAVYFYNRASSGVTSGSDEGGVAISAKRIPPNNWYHGTINTTSGAGDINPTLTYVSGNDATIDGGFLLNITKGTISGSLNGGSSILSLETNSGVAPTFLKKLPVTGVSLPLTTAAGVATGTILPGFVLGDNPQLITVTVDLVKIGGVFPAFAVNDVVTIAGANYPEQSIIQSAGAVSGTNQQTLTLKVRCQNFGAIIFRGGIQGTCISFPQNITFGFPRSTYMAVGSMTGSDMIFCFQTFGDTTQSDIPQVGAEAATTTSPFDLFPYAEVVVASGSSSTPTLEQNRVVWAHGDVVESPPNPAQDDGAYFMDIFYQSPQYGNGSPVAEFTFINGPGFGGGQMCAKWIRCNNPLTMYTGGGGPLFAPVFFRGSGFYREYLSLDETPVGGSVIGIQNNDVGGDVGLVELKFASGGTIKYDVTNLRWQLPRIDVVGYFVGGVAGIDATIATAKLTGGGANGSMTFAKGILVAQTPAT